MDVTITVDSFARWMCVHLAAAGLSQAGLACQIGRWPHQVSRWMNGHTVPDEDAALDIAEALGRPALEALDARRLGKPGEVP